MQECAKVALCYPNRLLGEEIADRLIKHGISVNYPHLSPKDFINPGNLGKCIVAVIYIEDDAQVGSIKDVVGNRGPYLIILDGRPIKSVIESRLLVEVFPVPVNVESAYDAIMQALYIFSELQ